MSTPNFLPIHLLENDTKVKTLLKMYLLNDEGHGVSIEFNSNMLCTCQNI